MAKKFCTLPGQAPIRIAKTDGRVVLIGEKPRAIPEDMEKDALGLGAYTEDQVADIKARLLADAKERTEDNRPDELKSQRQEEIRQAIVLLLNEGDPEKFTGKKPKVGAIETLTGFDITAEERDSLFDEIALA